MGGDDNTKLSIEEVLYLATRGGAKVVNLEDKIGGFDVGKEWDAQLIGFGADISDEEGATDEINQMDESPVDMFGWETWDDRIAKWLKT
ncbi:putative guanine deaminase [Glarea lozoyensis 74030]|uniref:Putative guanine deaminase n=1 Tax=Glarea lozoyensis (strain ATCC 74030 / MF5533) TaxID=1104152 RepID=H0EGW5_GLAL7|nr:putative guanine deaminase [Glarea lozoyensis 74030]